MFIPNKTFNAIKVSILSTIMILLLVIAAESVLYIRLSQNTNKKIETLSAQLDSVSNQTNTFKVTSSNKHKIVDNQITDAVTSIAEISTGIDAINTQIANNKRMIDILVDNQCDVRPYYLDKRLAEFCK
jgi:hypothetical protein